MNDVIRRLRESSRISQWETAFEFFS
jgi:hypothetical protein